MLFVACYCLLSVYDCLLLQCVVVCCCWLTCLLPVVRCVLCFAVLCFLQFAISCVVGY